MRRTKQFIGAAGVCASLLVLASCKDPSFFQALGDKIAAQPLAISPSTLTIQVNGTATFRANGGSTPYVFSSPTGGGTIDTSSGAYTAGGTAGPASVRVTDSRGRTADAAVTVTPTGGALSIAPGSVNLNATGALNFIATGGTPPYNFSIQTGGSAPGVGVTAAGLYTAGQSVGADVVKVTDFLGATSTATVNVVPGVSTVDYTIESAPPPVLPAAGTGQTALPGGQSFKIKNVGTGTGGQTVNWWVFMSPTPAPGSGAILLQSGSVAGFAPASPATVGLAWTWPSPPTPVPESVYLHFMVSAGDDFQAANNIYSTPGTITLSPPDVKYNVFAVTSGAPIVAGGPLAGTLTIDNAGTSNGSQTIHWTAYVSTDPTNVIDGSCIVVASGTQAGIAAAGSVPIPFTGTWPAAPGAYYLKAAISASDDTTAGDDVKASTVVNTTFVDYAGTPVTGAAGTAGFGIAAATFTLDNVGTADGSQTVSWTAYVSTNNSASITIGDVAVDSSTHAQMTAAQAPAVIGIGGNWPAGSGGTRYLKVSLASLDDHVTANDVAVSGPITVVVPDVRYAVGGVANFPPNLAGGPLSGQFIITNSGVNTGTQTIHWTAYVSTDPTNVIDGSCVVVAAGTHIGVPTGPQAIPFTGTWPAVFGAHYLKAAISAADDTTAGDDSAASALVTVTRVDYNVTAVNHLSGTLTGAAFTANFTAHNAGDANGASNVFWSAYASSNTVLDAGDALVASGNLGGGLAAGGSQVVPFGGTWPAAPGSYYLIISVSAADEQVGQSANNQANTAAPVVVTVPNIDYLVMSVTAPGGFPLPTGLVNGNFTYRNNLSDNGVQPVNYVVYASINTTLDASDVVVASGVVPSLNGNTTSGSMPFSGTWPLAYGAYYLIVQVSAADDINNGNNTAANAAPTNVGIIAETETNNNLVTFADAGDLLNTGVTGVRMRPGMSLKVTGTMPAPDLDDVFKFDTGTAASITGTWTIQNAGAGNDFGVWFYKPGPSTLLQGYTAGGAPGLFTISSAWSPDAGNATRYIDLFNGNNRNLGNWTLIINGN